ncbi:hypothetical protein CLAFUW4_11746 [Fulvia fulva]|nr:hypothetical protein CLAFUR4_11751 [Fulvia fulva]WPV18454.1 hypothetical protein CLAFUW4_11746 [Fulvia fulva]WPV33220.1 hypothetical protein CLAFUW7_11753 [Fulvia fulva]
MGRRSCFRRPYLVRNADRRAATLSHSQCRALLGSQAGRRKTSLVQQPFQNLTISKTSASGGSNRTNHHPCSHPPIHASISLFPHPPSSPQSTSPFTMTYTSMLRDKSRVSKRQKSKPSSSSSTKPVPDMADFDDELLLILLRNLHNAATTFGEGTPPYENIRKVVEDHLNDMKRKGKTTNIAKTRQRLDQSEDGTSAADRKQVTGQGHEGNAEAVSSPMLNLTIRPKPESSS